MTTKTLTGPNGIRIELDSAEIYPADPGQGTPAMVYLGRGSATYWYATDTGEIEDHPLSARQRDWLDQQAEAVDAFLAAHQG